MTGLFAFSFTLLWTSMHALSNEFYVPSPADQLLCSDTYHKTGVCKSVMYDIKHLSCILKKNTSEPGHESRMLTFKKVSMCVPVCDESCDGLTTASSVNFCRQIRGRGLSNTTDLYQPNPLHMTEHVSPNISLHQACEEGNLCLVRFILSGRPDDINTQDRLGRTPVMAAVRKQQIAVFDFLVSQSCDLMAVDNDNDSVLHVACSGGSADIVRKLVVNNICNIESRGEKGMTAVMKSALHGHRAVFDLLVSKGCNLTTFDDNMNNIFHVACSGGHVDMVKYVLKKLNSDIESRGETGRTPVMIAVHNGHEGVFDFLASTGSNLFAVDANVDNILHIACIGGHVAMVKHIPNQSSLGIESKAKYGQTPVMRAAQYNQRSVVDFLVSSHCNQTAVDNDMDTLLHIVCIGGHLDMVKHILFKIKIPIDSRGQFGRTPVMLSAYFGHVSIFNFLVNQGCRLMLSDHNKDNILHMACMGGHVIMVKRIVEKHIIGIENRGFLRRTPVMAAASLGGTDVVKYLVSKGCKLSMLDNNKNNILHLACMSGSVDMVKYILLQTNLKIDCRGYLGRTPVMAAASIGRTDVVKYLVKKGCRLSMFDLQGNNILHIACLSGYVDVVMYILTQTKIPIDSRDLYKKQTPVMAATIKGYLSVVEYLVSKGCNLKILNNVGNNILHVACIFGHVNIVQYILSQTNISIDCRGHLWRTPVMVAAAYGHESVVNFLVNQGCRLTILDKNKNGILHVACMGGNVNIVKRIVEKHIIRINNKEQLGRTPVMTAASLGQTDVVEYLVSKGCRLSMVDIHGNNILHVACLSGSIDIVEYILSQTKIPIESRGLYKLTPVMTAVSKGFLSLVEYLVSRGCKLSMLDIQGNNILHVACISGSVDTVKYILSQTNIAIDCRGYYGWTPVMFAAKLGRLDVVRYLVGKGCKLTTVDENGRNILELACMGRHENIVKYLITVKSWSKIC